VADNVAWLRHVKRDGCSKHEQFILNHQRCFPSDLCYLLVRTRKASSISVWFKSKEDYYVKMSVSDDYFMDYVNSVYQAEGERVLTRTQSMLHDAGYGLGLSAGVLADALSALLVPTVFLAHDIMMTKKFQKQRGFSD